MNDSTKLTEKLLTLARLRRITFRPGEYLFKRLSQHLKLIRLHSKQTKQKWFQEAFREQLKAQQNFFSEDILIEKVMHLKLEEELYKEIEKVVSTIKKFRNYSTKQWMIDAIYNKLDREEEKSKKLLEEKIDCFSSDKNPQESSPDDHRECPTRISESL